MLQNKWTVIKKKGRMRKTSYKLRLLQTDVMRQCENAFSYYFSSKCSTELINYCDANRRSVTLLRCICLWQTLDFYELQKEAMSNIFVQICGWCKWLSKLMHLTAKLWSKISFKWLSVISGTHKIIIHAYYFGSKYS